MNKASTIGLDLAKQVFQVHGADATGAVVFRKRLRRTGVLQFFAFLRRRVELRWKPALLRIIGAASFPLHWPVDTWPIGFSSFTGCSFLILEEAVNPESAKDSVRYREIPAKKAV